VTEPADQTEAMAGAQITSSARPDEPVVLGGRYELTERIASGGMASVWRAHDDVLARTVAVKLLHDHLAADADFRERFRREAIAAAKLTHPHVVSLYDTGNEGDRVYLVMEFVDGATLREVMGDLGKLEPGQAAAIGERIARALDYAHERGLVHRDVKPANILIGDDGCVKVADFGIAKADEHDGDLTKTGMVLGTAAYVAPEQITGATVVDGRADQYALGCMLYEALTGRQPFKGDTAVATAAQRLESSPAPLRSLRPDIPRGLDSIVMRAMARNPEDRFVSAGALADALAAFADPDLSSTAALPLQTVHRAAPRRSDTPSSGFEIPPPPPRGDSFLRSEGRWLLAVLVLIAVAGGLVGLAVVSGLLDPDRLPGGVSDGDRAEPDTQDLRPVDVAEIASFDPFGDDGENDESLPSLTDGDKSTTWRTDIYNSAEFGGLKDGLGFTLDLGDTASVSALELGVESAGVNLQVLTAAELSDDIDDWEPIGELGEARGEESLELDEPIDARYLLVWITAPLPSDGGYKAEFNEIRVLGPEQ
jgi:serine/threonine-protein kinase